MKDPLPNTDPMPRVVRGSLSMESRVTSATLVGRLHNLQDQEAWRQFVDFYGPMVYRLGRRRGLDREAADALVQTICARAVELMPKFQYTPERGRFRGWVLTVALNEIRQDKRRDAARARGNEDYKEQQIAERGEQAADDLDRWWESEESSRILQVALERLKDQVDPEKFAVFQLTALRGMDPEEVAASYGMTKPQVAVIKHRMIARLSEIVRQLEEQWEVTWRPPGRP